MRILRKFVKNFKKTSEKYWGNIKKIIKTFGLIMEEIVGNFAKVPKKLRILGT